MEQKTSFFNDFIGIGELILISKKRDELERKEKQLTIPAIPDYSLIPQIYQWYTEMTSGTVLSRKRHKTLWLQKFVFIAICLFSPKTFTTGRMRFGFRKNLIAAIQQGKDSSCINKYFDQMKGFYFYNKEIRNELNMLYYKILHRYQELDEI